jgi:serine/threonine protein kinase
MAPEIAAAALNDEIEPKFSFSSDCWSIGCCIHTMYTDIPPFQGKNITDTLLNITTYGKLYSDAQIDLLRGRYVSKDMCELIVGILSVCPTDRPTAAQIADRCLEIYFSTMKKELDFIG